MNAITNIAMLAQANAVALRDFNNQPPRQMDRITFNTSDDGILAGYVSMLSHHVGTGQRFAWVEVDNALPGSFRTVFLTDIITCDGHGDARRNALDDPDVRRLCLADFSGSLVDRIMAAEA